MNVLTSLADVAAQPSVVSIGNFDGLHLGHRAILKTVVERARALGVRSVAMTFDPHPIHFLAPDRAPKLISTLDQKIRLIEHTGIDLLFIAKFDEAFSRLSPEDFIRRYLEEGFRARSVCVGSNFNFGYRQKGTIETLRRWKRDLEVIEVPPVRVRGMLASSTRIRDLVSKGRTTAACRLLGRWLQIAGPVVSGAGRGRSVTVPTLNVQPENQLIPKMGVYATRISLDGGDILDSITNVGVRPTFDEHQLTVETFVMDRPVRGESMFARLQFLRRLRDEVKFESAEALRRQIGIDVERCRKFFRLLNNLRHAEAADSN
jgi:riboflavin kinase/FMN adenylyltransferase